MAAGCKAVPFEVHDPGVAELFSEGVAVLLLTVVDEPGVDEHGDGKDGVDHPEGTPIGMLIDKHDYESHLYRHKYTPLLYLAPLHWRVAYLYACLNFELRGRRDCTHVFWWRRVRSTVWHKWFTVHPYLDAIYDPDLDPVYLPTGGYDERAREK
uniref:Uncharacterized protein n=1 Tax=Marseillevirus LCMAC103 TaxID=2506604 RepID=A0A481YVD4_9VIRU|nr:MAG: hypothetical protein LCMAC103_01990 [Marseillevirus LCMAC103]